MFGAENQSQYRKGTAMISSQTLKLPKIHSVVNLHSRIHLYLKNSVCMVHGVATY